MLNGPSFIPKDPKNALILLHGYGADGADLFTLSEELKKHFKNMAFFAPNAPTVTIGGGYEWFSLDDYFSKPTLDINYLNILETRAIEKLPIVEEYISQKERTNLCIKDSSTQNKVSKLSISFKNYNCACFGLSKIENSIRNCINHINCLS